MPMSQSCSDPEPDPYWDPAEFFITHGEYEAAAQHLNEGDAYRKGQLALDAAGVTALRQALAPRGLTLHDDVTHWLVAAAGDDDDANGEPPPADAAPPPDGPLDEGSTVCAFGVHPVAGPPEPFCCERRRAYLLQNRSAETEHPAFGTVYVDEPGHLLTFGRLAAGLCVICGVADEACQCRWCDGCSRFWGATASLPRDPEASHYGIVKATCPGCQDGSR